MLFLLTLAALSTHALLADARVVKSERGLPIDISALAACDSVKSRLSNQSQVFNFRTSQLQASMTSAHLCSAGLPQWALTIQRISGIMR